MTGQAIIAFGTNLPFNGLHGAALIRSAIEDLSSEGLILRALSSMHETLAWPDPTQPMFTNAVGVFYAPAKDAQAVLDGLLRVEARFGRVRSVRNAARTLDLDLLDFEGRALDTPGLLLPHPRLSDRAFVLAPLAEAAPEWRHPLTGLTAADMLARLDAAHRDGP